MKLNSYLWLLPSGLIYLRNCSQHSNIKISLRTRGIDQVPYAAYLFGSLIAESKVSIFNKIGKFEIELSDSGNIKKVKTDGSVLSKLTKSFFMEFLVTLRSKDLID